MIIIDNLYVKQCESKIRLYCDLNKEGIVSTVWYEFEPEYEEYICTERIDGIVVNILLFCMENNYNIKSKIPMSERLYYQITNILMPSIAKNISKYKEISIDAPLDNNIINKAGAVGTGVSGGVDSFYTILKNVKSKTEKFNITHLTFFNAGASGNFGGEKSRELFNKRITEIKPIAEELNIPLITVDTNINEFIHQKHQQTHTFRSLAIPLLIQKLFSVYYYASGYEYCNFHFGLDDTSGYDLLNCMCLSNENILFYSSGSEMSRIEKVRFISDNKIVQKYLDVCISGEKNCGECGKCRRTLLELFALGKVEEFNKVFDLDFFRKKKDKYIAEILHNKKTNLFSEEIYKMLKENKIRISLKSKTYYLWYVGFLNFLKKIYRKIIKK